MLLFESKLRFVLNMLPSASTAGSEIFTPRRGAVRRRLKHFNNFCFEMFFLRTINPGAHNIPRNSPFDKHHHTLMTRYARPFKPRRINRQFKDVTPNGHQFPLSILAIS
jgi:hypothetical protein